MTIEDVLGRFEHVRPNGDGWTARCAGHKDTNNSLSISQKADGTILLNCFVGCKTAQVIAAVGLTWPDLYPPKDSPVSVKRGVTIAELAAAKGLPAELFRSHGWREENGRIVIPYRDERGKETSRPHIRWALRAVDGSHWGGPKGGLIDTPYGAWRLEEFRKGGKLAICEGETDCLTMWHVGKPAIGIPGAKMLKMLRPELVRGFSHVIVFRDNDDAGEQFGSEGATRVVRAGVPKAQIIAPPASWKDVNDWYRRNPAAFSAELQAAVRTTPVFEAPHQPATEPVNGRPLQFIAVGDLLSEPDEVVRWVVKDRIPRGSVCLLAGKPKAGKSTLARALALQVAKGGHWLGFSCVAGPVWFLVFEDKKSEVRTHFRQMGATDADPIRLLFPRGIDDLIAKLHEHAQHERPALIIVDTLQRLIRARDLNDYADVTDKLTPVLALSRETEAALLLVHHAGKGDRAGIDAVLGSTALAGSVDNILMLGRTEQYRLVASVQRIGPDLPQTVVTLDADSGHVALGLTRAAADQALIKTAILTVLGDRADPMTESELGKEIEGRTGDKREALRTLVREGQVVRSGAGRKGNPYRYGNACSLVPESRWEQENEKSKTLKNTDKQGSDSRSQELPLSGRNGGSREQAFLSPGPGSVPVTDEADEELL